MRARPVLVFILIILGARAARAAITATRVDGGGRPAWAIVRIAFTPQRGDAEVRLQDARGGPAMVRVVAAGADAALIPMPLVAPAQLKGASWPLEVTLRAGARNIEHAAATVSAGTEATFRVAVPAGTPEPLLRLVHWTAFTDLPVAFVEWPALELESPPLLFAGCDAVVATDQMPANDAQMRAMAALGTRVIYLSDTGHPPAAPESWVWDHAGDAAGNVQAWTSPAVTFRRPAVIEPGLADLSVTAPAPPPGMTAVALLVGPAALVAVVLARGLFRGGRAAFFGAAVGILAVTTGAVACLRATDAPVAERTTLREVIARPDAAAGAAWVTETLGSRSSFLGRSHDVVTAEEGCLYPIAATPRAYFALKGWELVLRGPTAELRGPLAAGQTMRYLMRTAQPAGALPALPDSADATARLGAAVHADAAAAHWVFGGYAFPGTALPAAWKDGVLFTTWAKGQDRASADAAAAWDALRFDATHRYFMWPDAGRLRWVDYGAAP